MNDSGQTRPQRIRTEVVDLLLLASPIIANNLALAGMSFVDTVFAGNISARDLAAVGVGNATWFVVFLFGLGILMAMSPMTAQSLGSGRSAQVGSYLRQSLWLSQALALAGIALLMKAGALMSAIGIAEEFRPLARDYVKAVAWGLPAIYAYLALRFTSEGIGHTRPIALVAILGLMLNAFGDWVFMFGKFGFPAMGAVGCGYATALTQWVMLLIMLWYMTRGNRALYAPLRLFERFEWPDFARLNELVRLGLPIGIGVLAEVGLFSAAALLMGRMGSATAGAHQVAINYASTAFMIPLGINSAIMARVGQKIGRNDHHGARFTGLTGITVSAALMLVSAIVLLLFADSVVGFYTNDAAVRQIALGLLSMAAIFQVSDGVQVAAMGALRGLKDTTVPMAISVFSYWGIGFPLAWYMVVWRESGPIWVWASLVAGLTVAAVLLSSRFLRITQHVVQPQS
ncbi:MAG: MATE family efflux transporter [Gammaproteobacteria bacterium]|nr:MATE family efflux transporter [Gammaproteobacteria bacterium]NNF60316.1 MATE family efflux transporter [Gammaproteobacteria bacterium]NNM20943.1 MATE family efflux transporter [Gammaproteobacteria bacterium]